MNEEKYKAFIELMKVAEVPQNITSNYLDAIEDAFVQLTFEIDINKNHFSNTASSRKYINDRMSYVSFAFGETVKYNRENYIEWVAAYGIDNYKNKRDVFIHKLEELKERAIKFREGLVNNESCETEIEKDFEQLEFKNLAQKLLLLETLGVLRVISEVTGEQITSRKMSRIIADLFNEKDETVRRQLRFFLPYSTREGRNNPFTIKNLESLHSNLEKLGLPELHKRVGNQLNELHSKDL